ncbi:SAM-dependent methyltransferase [Xanthomonadaceae bacterium JHOS43]|nr:SAM-dependent methyltransferase [Xanthomonadaceae bacterium JHOS43]MCX7564553.1 SAM-dependent methyltransferase [Xanthomonadaceae bacterium XH05]
MRVDLPEPEDAARSHSDELAALIRAVIEAEGGAIPFSRYMELALYAPGLGYYSAGAQKFGRGGDFVTAPELGPLFAQCVAESVAPVLRQLGGGQFLELGGGSGAFAQDALVHLAMLDALPSRYAILEPSADLRERQRERLGAALPLSLFERVVWLDGPPDADWRGVLFANEVLDALPVPRFAVHGGELHEEFVALDPQRRFIRVDQPADGFLTAAVRHVERYLDRPFADGFRSEVLPQLPYWIQAVGGLLREGAMLFVDYGHPRRDFYASQRRDGTLRGFYRHRLVEDPFLWPGLTDLTASVDFTALAEAGTGAGFELTGYTTQAGFLFGNRLAECFETLHGLAQDEAARYAVGQQVKQLTLPGMMGESFQAMGFARGVDFGHAFLQGDLRWRL